METRYYSPAETKLALHASRKVFDRITGHLERKNKLNEEIEKITKHRQYLRDETKAMTADWDNSIQNIRLRKEEAREQKLTQKADDRVEQYFKILKLQAEDRKKYNEEVAKRIFLTRNPQKDLNSKLTLAECMHINEKQIKLKNKQRKIDEDDWKEYEQQLIDEDAQFKKSELKKKCENRAKTIKNQEFLTKQAAEINKCQNDERQMKIDTEMIEILEQNKEIENIERIAAEKYSKGKECSIKTLKDAREIARKIHEMKEKSESERENACQIYRNMKIKRDCMLKKIKEENLQEVLQMQEKAAEALKRMQSQKLLDEDRRTMSAAAALEEKELLKQQVRKEYDEMLKFERKQNYETALIQSKDKKEKEHEMKKWEMLNCVKLREIAKNEEDKKKENKKNKVDKYAVILNEQIEDNKKMRSEKKAYENSFKWNNNDEIDEKFLQYGAEMLAKQKVDGKPTFPIEAGIKEYKRRHGLVTNELPGCCEHNKLEEKVKRQKTISRRICPGKYDSSGVKDCFCN